MLKGYDFDQMYRPIGKRSVYQQEFDLIHDFLASDHKVLRLEYSTVIEARNARAAIVRYACKNKQPVCAKARGAFVFVIRKEDAE